MSYGLAQFSLSAINAYNKGVEANEKKKEAAADKLYERGRQKVSDSQAQERHNIVMQSDQITLAGQQKKQTIDNNAFNFEDTYNNAAYLKSIGDNPAAADTIIRGANQHSAIPFKVDIERDETGKVVERKDENGNPFYYQTIYDKESGIAVGNPTAITLNELEGSLKQLNNGKAIAEATAAYQQKLKEEQRKAQGELSLYKAKKNVDVEADGIEAERDHIYKIDEMGIKHGYTLDELGVKHGYTIDLEGVRHANRVDLTNVQSANRINELGVKHGYTIDLEGVRHANRVDLTNVQSANRINEYVGRSDVNSGGTPTISGGGNDGSIAGIIASLTGTESGGVTTANRTNKDGRSFGGLLQMGDARLTDYANATGTKPITAMEFKNLSASQQAAVNNWHIQDLTRKAKATGAIGKTINGVPVTLGGLVAIGHLGGSAGMNKFVQSNGRYNPSDESGTSLTDYLKKHASGGIQVSRSVPAVPGATGGTKGTSTKTPTSVTAAANINSYNDVVAKGLVTAQKTLKDKGIKVDVASQATLALTATGLRSMAQAQSKAEFEDAFRDAYASAQDVIPDSKMKKLNKGQRKALVGQIIYDMAGVSSLPELKAAIAKFNPAINQGGASGATLPGKQSKNTGSRFEQAKAANQQAAEDAFNGVKPTRGPYPETPQVGKLAALYAGKTTPIKTDPKTGANLKSLENLSNDMGW